MNRFANIGEIADPYEQRWVMRSAGFLFPLRAGLMVERCA
jgi:hypothetical protein